MILKPKITKDKKCKNESEVILEISGGG